MSSDDRYIKEKYVKREDYNILVKQLEALKGEEGERK
jgi:hypothetical protein